jgi:hypothetical protein
MSILMTLKSADRRAASWGPRIYVVNSGGFEQMSLSRIYVVSSGGFGMVDILERSVGDLA